MKEKRKYQLKKTVRDRKYTFNEKGAASPHSDEFRRSVSQEVISGRLTTKEACITYGVTVGSVNSFIRWYKKNHHIGVPIIIEKPMSQEELDDLQKAKRRLIELEKSLKDADLKIFSLETMITVAENEFQILIRKKFGSKQSL